MNTYNKEEFEKLKNKVKDEYQSIGKIYSPALKSELVFNANGFHHLRYDNTRAERSKLVQMNKFRFFSDAVNTLRISTTVQEYRELNSVFDARDRVVEYFAFWSVISLIKRIRIRVIVKRVGGENGQYHFWSLMPFWSLRHRKRIIAFADLSDE